MTPIFLSNLKIYNLRHLQDVDIHVSSTERRHLILTGKNGSGKSTILNEIKNHILVKTLGWMPQYHTSLEALNQYKNIVNSTQSNIKNHTQSDGELLNENIYGGNAYIESFQKQGQQAKSMVQFLEDFNYSNSKRSESYFFNQDQILDQYNMGRFITSYYDAKRSTSVGSPSGIIPIRFRNNYAVSSNISGSFLQYIVNLKAEQSFANDENDIFTRNTISKWFENFENQLKFIFDNDSLVLKFDRRSFNFFINIDNRNSFDFNSMSEGFSAVLSIVTDLLLRSEQKISNQYSGIVLIDEVETHLHIDLQKKILPFLINLFPNIQFIVTTHSPFILNSISNTVIYDVERRVRFEDFSAFSSEGIIEGYFRQDKYSEVIKQKIERFDELSNKSNLSGKDSEELKFLKEYFEHVPKFYSKELELKIEQIKLSALV